MTVGVFEVEVKIRNWQNQFLPEDQRGEEITCPAIVDSGAIELCLPVELVERLKLAEVGHTRVRTADGAAHDYRLMGILELEVQGRTWQGRAIELPRASKPLLGAIPLEAMDWHISPKQRKLVPNPESPDEPTVWLLRT